MPNPKLVFAEVHAAPKQVAAPEEAQRGRCIFRTIFFFWGGGFVQDRNPGRSIWVPPVRSQPGALYLLTEITYNWALFCILNGSSPQLPQVFWWFRAFWGFMGFRVDMLRLPQQANPPPPKRRLLDLLEAGFLRQLAGGTKSGFRVLSGCGMPCVKGYTVIRATYTKGAEEQPPYTPCGSAQCLPQT